MWEEDELERGARTLLYPHALAKIGNDRTPVGGRLVANK